MNNDSWSCLMVESGSGIIPDMVRIELKKAACELHLKGRDRMPLAGELDGVIETNWTSHVVGTRSGILFRSQFDSEAGSSKVNFLLNTKDLERGAEIIKEWIENNGGSWSETQEPFPVKELHHFYDLRSDRRLR